MTAITTLTKDQIKLLMSSAIMVRDKFGFTYYHLPNWFKDIGYGEFEVLTFDQLSESAKEIMKDQIPNEIIHY